MISLQATIRDNKEKINALRKSGIMPAVLYGEGIESAPIKMTLKDFQEVFSQAGESSLVSLEVAGKKYDVLIHQLDRDPVSGQIIHADFYQPSTKRKVVVEVSLVFEGESLAVKDLDGTLVKEMQEVEVKGLAISLPREIVVDITSLKTFNDRICIADLKMPEGVECLKHPEEIVALVVPQKEEKETSSAIDTLAEASEKATEGSDDSSK
ncbi:MAG: 50S ribosomal protein L25 [Candidatus Gribaldobacteria bacterium]|nr:50S ribosomal protein L25 [Candidatus Gribaldobacteria bacterium]